MTDIKKHDIIVKTRKKLFLETHGEHTSIFNGNGLEFSDIREYNIDDDIRHINWKITARNQKPSVNLFNESKQLNVVLVYLNSGGLYFGTKRSKKELAVEVMTSISYAVITKKDILTSLFFDRDERFFYKPTKHKSIVDINYDTAINLDPLKNELDYKALTEYLMDKVRKRSLIFLIGDFLKMPDLGILGQKHEVYCTVLRDRAEEDLSLMGEFDIVDTNSLTKRNIVLDRATVKSYNKKMQEYDKELFYYLKNSNIKYEKIYTDDDIYKKLDHLTRV